MWVRNRNFGGYIFLLTVIVMQSCAQVGSPTGGVKDTIAPEVISYSPANYSTNFKGKSIEIEFDEYVQFRDIYNELIVSPPLSERPDISIRKKSIIIELKDELKTNATYIFNFGSGVTDYTEGNPAEELLYVFSTGNEIDSLSVVGKVVDAFSRKGMESVKVMLYEEDLDSLPYLEKPYYFSQTDEKGNFSIDYVKEGAFKIIALKDENSNYKYDSGEAIAFLDSLVSSNVSDSSIVSNELYMNTEKDTVQFISDYSRDSTGFVRMALNCIPDSLEFDLINSSSKFYFENDEENDSIYFWLIDSPSNSDVDLIVKDGGLVLDTLPIQHYKLDACKQVIMSSKGSLKFRVQDGIQLNNTEYLSAVNEEFIELLLDSVEVDSQTKLDSVSKRQLNLSALYNPGSSYQLTLYPGAVINLFGATNDTLVYNFESYKDEFYGEIIIKLIGIDEIHSGILQLVNKNPVTIPVEGL